MGNYQDAIDFAARESDEKLSAIVDAVSGHTKMSSEALEVPTSGETREVSDSEAPSAGTEEP